LQTKNLTLVPHVPAHLIALEKSTEDYENVSGLMVAEGVRDYLLAASPEFFVSLRAGSKPDPWKFGFAIFHTAENRIIGLCGFPGPPDCYGVAEIAYGVALAYQGKGYATEVAWALIEFASADARVTTIRAHTLPTANASTRVLEKCGFKKVAETIDPENGIAVWQWERSAK
jgi:ribosomal-protein-alanine N-acetyltransferase